MKAKGHYRSLLKSDGSQGSQTGEAVRPERWPKVTPEGPSGSSPLRSDGSRDGQVGRLDRVSGGQKTLNEIT
jgi:hypothetical protein